MVCGGNAELNHPSDPLFICTLSSASARQAAGFVHGPKMRFPGTFNTESRMPMPVNPETGPSVDRLMKSSGPSTQLFWSNSNALSAEPSDPFVQAAGNVPSTPVKSPADVLTCGPASRSTSGATSAVTRPAIQTAPVITAMAIAPINATLTGAVTDL